MQRTKHRCLVLLLTVLLGLVPHQGSAHDATGGASTVVDDVITTTRYNTLLAVTFDFSAFPHHHHCVATASAEAVNPAGTTLDNKYIFVLSLDSTTPITNHPSARTIDFDDNPVLDEPNFLEVSSTFFFGNIAPGQHTIRWMARKVGTDDENLTVEDSSLTIVCTQRLLE
jgi:hypothetical protein